MVTQKSINIKLNEKELNEIKNYLEKYNALIKKDNNIYVDLEKMNRQYIREFFSGNIEFITHKNSQKQVIRLEKFVEVFQNIKRNVSKGPPIPIIKDMTTLDSKTFVDYLFSQNQNFNAKRIGIEGSITGNIPIPSYTTRVENKKVEFIPKIVAFKESSKYSTKEYSGGPGVFFSTKTKKLSPGAEFNFSGFFLNALDVGKKITAGVTSTIFEFSLSLVKKVKYFFSIVLGPWRGVYDFISKSFRVTFLWPIVVIELIKRSFGRAFEEEEVGSVKINKKNLEKGTSFYVENLQSNLEIKNIERDKNGNIKKITALDEEGKEYIVEETFDENFKVYKKVGFFGKLKKALNPRKVLYDVFDIIVFNPLKDIKNTYHSFVSPLNNKIEDLSNDKESKIFEEVKDAMRRNHFETARHKLYLLRNSTKNETNRAKYENLIDEVEWKIANRGFPILGYIAGYGFGNKRKIVEKNISKKIEESINALEKNDQSKVSKTFAYSYLSEKTKLFTIAGVGKLIPSVPLPEHLSNKVFDALNKYKSLQPSDFNVRINIPIIDEDIKFIEHLDALQKIYSLPQKDLEKLLMIYDKIALEFFNEKNNEEIKKALQTRSLSINITVNDPNNQIVGPVLYSLLQSNIEKLKNYKKEENWWKTLDKNRIENLSKDETFAIYELLFKTKTN